jgi:hypothetical protein
VFEKLSRESTSDHPGLNHIFIGIKVNIADSFNTKLNISLCQFQLYNLYKTSQPGLPNCIAKATINEEHYVKQFTSVCMHPTQLKIIADHHGLETMEAQEKPTFSTV